MWKRKILGNSNITIHYLMYPKVNLIQFHVEDVDIMFTLHEFKRLLEFYRFVLRNRTEFSTIQNNFEDYLGGKYILECRPDTFDGLDFMNAYEDVYTLKGNGAEYILQNDDLYTISSMCLYFYGNILFEKLHDQFRMLETLKEDNTLYSKSVCTIVSALAESSHEIVPAIRSLPLPPCIGESIQATVERLLM